MQTIWKVVGALEQLVSKFFPIHAFQNDRINFLMEAVSTTMSHWHKIEKKKKFIYL